MTAPQDKTPDRLSLALEPEAAGLFCHNSGEHHRKPQHFTVLDIGGGTVDITSYRIDRGHICMIDKASGNDMGGTRVNENFEKFLETIVDDPGFTQYVSDQQLQQRHKADLNKLIYGEFERQKIVFGDEENTTSPATLMIPNSFVKFYKRQKLEAAINLKYKDVVELDGSELTIDSQKMKEFFQPSIDEICKDAVSALERVEKEVDKLEAVFLVGGFGGCKLIKKVVQDVLHAKYGTELEVFVPIDHIMAIACGAITFRRNPEIIWARKAEATYGDIVEIPFDAGTHDPAYKVFDDESGKDYCTHLFRPFTIVGDTISADKVLQNTLLPHSSNQTEMHYAVYSSNQHDIWYAQDVNHKLVDGLQEVGTLVFDLQGIPGENRDDKRITFTIDLSQTEIQLKAHHEKTGKEVKVVFDTLCLES